jgi:hypothetical protein
VFIVIENIEPFINEQTIRQALSGLGGILSVTINNNRTAVVLFGKTAQADVLCAGASVGG